MHEMAIAQGILDISLDAARRNGAVRISRIKLRVGEMTEVEPDALIFCFSAVAAGTEAEGAELAVEVVPLTGRCADCGQGFPISNYRFYCPACGSAGVSIETGRELLVEELEAE